MDKRYGLDAITYLIDPPDPTGATSQWQTISLEDRRSALLRGIAVKQRELAALNAELGAIGDDETYESPRLKPTQPGPFRWLRHRLLGAE